MLTTERIHQRIKPEVCAYGGLPLWLALRCLPVLVLLQMLLLLLAASPARSAVDAVSLNEVEGGHLLFESSGGVFQRAVLQHSEVHFDITGLVATVRLQQTFRNDSSEYREGVYAFPLPSEAAVRAMEMRIGERRIVGRVREKQEAKKIYRAAKKAGKKASLVEQQRPNLFTNRVANIGPGEEITVMLEYVEPVAYSAGVFSLRFPMTITPRYMPGTPVSAGVGEALPSLSMDPYLGWAQATDQVTDAGAISPLLFPDPGSDSAPLNAITISARLDMGMPLAIVNSPYHDIALSRSAGVYDVKLLNKVSEMDRDFVLEWEPVAQSAPQAALFTEKVGEDYYGLLMVVPPARTDKVAPIARELIFVVDTSGSMGGVSIEQARASLSLALRQLRPGDRFNLIEFNNRHRALFRTAMPATRHHVAQAQEFVRQLQASGGTEMMSALRAALSGGAPAPVPAAESMGGHPNTPLLRQIVFITDGAVGNEDALFGEIAAGLGDSRLFTVGIGSAPNSWFMRKAAEFGRGSHTHIGDLNEVGSKMAALFQQLSRPAAVDLAISWPQPVEAWPEHLPDLYLGQPLSIAVKFGPQVPAGEVTVSADIGGQPWQRALSIQGQPDGGAHAGVGSLWARRKIDGLLDRVLRGDPEATVRAEVLPLALAHQLMSPYTSFVAVEERISRPEGSPLHAAPLPNTRPQGQSPQHFAYPRTATTAPAKAWLALLALFIAVFTRVIRQGEVDHVAGRA